MVSTAGPRVAIVSRIGGRLMTPFVRPLRVSTVALVLLGASFGSSAAQTARRALTLADLSAIKSVGDPRVSPDGRWVVYTVGTVNVEKDTRDTDLWMTSWDGAEQIR